MSYRTLVYEKQENVVCLFLNRPESANRVSQELARELADACLALNEDDDVRVAVLAARGPAFSLGADLAELADSVKGQIAKAETAASLATRAIAGVTAPVIAALEGDALGPGLELALACDLRIASPGVKLGLPETTIGLIPAGGGTQRLPRLVGRGRALEMVLLGQLIDAEEGHRLGLVSELAAPGQALARARAVAATIATRGPIAVRYAKEAVSKGMDLSLEQGLRLEMDLSVILQTTRDREEGIRAFLDKRQAEFKGE